MNFVMIVREMEVGLVDGRGWGVPPVVFDL